MATNNEKETLIGEILNDENEVSLRQICNACQLPAEIVIEYVEYGVIEPVHESKPNLLFHSHSISRILTARRLQDDLGLNNAGVALAIDLLDELNELRHRLRSYEVD